MTKQLAKLEAGLVQLGFAVAGGAVEHGGNLIVLEAFYIVENEDHAVAGRQGGYGALESDAVDRAAEEHVLAAEVALGGVVFRRVDGLFERDEVEAFFAQVHEDEVDGEAMQPGGEGGFAAEAADFAEEVEEGLLGHVFGFGDVAEHAKAEGVDTALVEGVELGKGYCIAIFCGLDRFSFADDGRISFEDTWGRIGLGHGQALEVHS